jgi:hypothetical protein
MECSVVRLPLKNEAGLSKRKFRGTWIQTVYQDEYKSMTPEQIQAEFVRKLNFLQACRINAIILQIRPEADAFYISDLDPYGLKQGYTEATRGDWRRKNANLNSKNPYSAHYFVIYRFEKKEKIDINNPSHFVAITKKTSYFLENKTRGEFRYVVTAVDRFHNESKKEVRIKIKT